MVASAGNMKILVINSGSSSIKYALLDTERHDEIFKGKVERIGERGAPSDHLAAMDLLFEKIDQKSLSEIEAVGHRVVHGGEKFRSPTVINQAVIAQIREVGRFVPLHCLPNLIGIEAAQKRLPSIPHVAVFDTAAFVNLERKAFLYGLPVELYEKHHIRRYGFHGINHSYIAQKVAQILEREKIKLISCHLGNGCSMTAFENNHPIDTSMGLTPLEGLMMGSRCGDIDPTIILYLIDLLGFTTEEVTELLNKKSGLFGLCGSNDMRDIHRMAENGDLQAKIAIELFVYRIQKYMGAYIAALGGVDVIAFTGGIGENDAEIRESIISNFGYIGAYSGKAKNQKHETIFSTDDSKVILMNIKANEERVIAGQTEYCLRTHDFDGFFC